MPAPRPLAVDFPNLTFEGALIAPAMIEKIHAEDAPEMAPGDYAIPPGLALRDEISRAFRIGRALHERFARHETKGARATRAHVAALLEQVFGFEDLEEAPHPLALAAGGGRVPVVCVPAADGLDRPSQALSRERRLSASVALQDYLNAHEEALWGLATNGLQIRLMRDNASLTRMAYVEADLARIFETEDIASFSLAWLLVHRTRFGRAGTPATDCPLERWREEGEREGIAVRDRLAAQVEEALAALGTGFLEANPELRNRLVEGGLDRTDFFNQLLRLVYRLIFLMVAEDRNLLHPPQADEKARAAYAQGYSTQRLRQLALRRAAWDRHHDRYEGLKVVFAALARGEPRLALPALGGLFEPGQMAELENARLPNRALMKAMLRLGWTRADDALVRINWQRMQTEELGSVYESLLELQPQLAEGGRRLAFATAAAEQRGNQRKTTGSYYTPDSLAQALLDSALDPVLDEAEAADDPEAALLEVTVIDPACGSGHFLIAAAHRIAGRLAAVRAGGTPSAEDRRHALRDVVRRCIHGVDRNPMAVELAKVALWIETVDPGRPLGFLDAQIRCGDSLLGVFDLGVLEEGIPDEAYKPLTGDEKAVAKHYEHKNRRERRERDRIAAGFGLGRARDLLAEFAALRAMPEDTLEEIEAKRARLATLTREGEPHWQLERACDLYVAAWLLPKTCPPEFRDPKTGLPRRGAETVPTSGTLWEYLRGVEPFGPLFAQAVDAAGEARAFHWPLEFPDVMAQGGFDVVIGNPPWEVIKLQEKEFFAARAPEIAEAPNKAARERMIRALADAPEGSPERRLYDEFIAAKHLAEAVSAFVRTPAEEGGRFPLTGTGDVNTYALFAELFARLARGRAGVIVPTGIATDFSKATFFRHVVRDRRLKALFSFNNTRYFSNVGLQGKQFCIIIFGAASITEFAFDLSDVSELSDPRRVFTLTPDQIAAINPNTRTAPVFRSRADAELTAAIYARVPVLINEGKGAAGNPWGVSFMAMFHMSNDSALFRTAAELQAEGFVRDGTNWVLPGIRPAQGALAVEGAAPGLLPLEGGGPRTTRYVPLYEAKMIHQFDHRWATYENGTTRDVTPEEKADPAFEPEPRYWVPAEEVAARLAAKGWQRKWLTTFRFSANPKMIRTLISSYLPTCGLPHILPAILIENRESVKVAASILSVANSIVVDFVCRNKMSRQGLDFYIVEQLPILPPAFYTPERLAFLTPRVLELTFTSHALAPFARDLGHDGPPFPWDEDRRAQLRAELDAFFARAYGLNRKQLRYILDPADLTPAEVASILDPAEEVADPLDEEAYRQRGAASDYPSETFRVLKDKEMRQYGEYRTRRLVLEAWARMEADGTFASLGL